MARSVYSTEFISAELTSASPVASYDVPAGFVAVIRDITGVLETVLGSGGSVVVIAGGLPFWETLQPELQFLVFHQELRKVAPGPTEIFAAIEGSSSAGLVTVSGYLLTLP